VQVQLHLDACRECLHLYRFEESLRRLVRVRCREQQAPDTLRERVLARLAEERLRREGPRSALTSE
jgi:mycothiol system anti-sigma-R factor